LDELKAAGLSRAYAKTVGIAVDHRRRNKTEEDFQRNVQRLQTYKSKLILFPRKANSKRVKKGDSTKDQLAKAVQNVSRNLLAFERKPAVPKARAITDAEREVDVWGKQRDEKLTGKRWALRQKRAQEKAEQGDKAAKKAAKKTSNADEE
jgi:large subunit ribosomal protein L13e